MNKKVIQTVVLVFVIGILITMVLGLRSQGSAVGIGDEAYDFELQDLEGNVHRLSDYKGKVVMLNFFATWCSACVAEAPELERFNDEFKDEVQLFVVVKGETQNTVRKYVDEKQSKKSYLFDFTNSISRKFGVIGQPETIVINEDGIIVDHFIGGVTRDFLGVVLNEIKGR
ncbi:TlpA family protein disulfide reductase [Anaerobacillus alkaliphilus]|uniref:TlpA family protein disulfide reductase n=1 Tax=Anaerobacillus alkaliphilus TaxID=1548597 RepID=A0A4V1LGG3_9BACI|nr:TlpA disulfide reductase family protein [Anaerobacillus alkaliphilus]RXJ01128.1 TlpA family protein disulfide reductase [Anaerobacillus alkaliphilus]